MQALVTGATGLVGNNVARILLAQGHAVRVLVRSNSPKEPLEGLDVEVWEGDVRDAAAVWKACRHADVVIHAAAKVHLGWRDLGEQQAVNVGGTQNVAAACLEEGARLVHVSSVDALAPGTPARPTDEESPDASKVPCSYVVTKRAAERVIFQFADRGLRANIVNPGFMLGPWDWKPSSGKMMQQIASHFTPVCPIGGVSVCDVRDVATALLAVPEQAPVGRRYILAGCNMTFFELWKRLAHVCGSRGPIFRAGPLMRVLGGRGGDLIGFLRGREPLLNSAAVRMSSHYSYYHSTRAAAELGYRNRPLDETLLEAWQWLQEYQPS